MIMGTVKFIVAYTIADDEVRDALREVITRKEKDGGLLHGIPINESTYAIKKGGHETINIITTLLKESVKDVADNIKPTDYINLYYAAHLVNYSCLNKNDLDNIVECPVLENGKWR